LGLANGEPIQPPETITKAPYPALNGGMVPVAPMGQLSMLTDYIKPEETFVTCPNQDVAYGLGFFELDKEPIVIQVPDFGERFWVYALYDARTNQIGNVGKPYGTKPGFYLFVGPNWKAKHRRGLQGLSVRLLKWPTLFRAYRWMIPRKIVKRFRLQ
jgi:hypothetical protein